MCGSSGWTIPGFEYLVVEQTSDDTFVQTIAYLKQHKLPLVGSVQEYYEFSFKNCRLCFPIRKLT